MTITADTTLTPGVYVMKKGITIAADNIILDGGGATLIGFDDTGKGVSVEGHKGVTIKNLNIERFRWGIYAKNADGITIQNCHIHRTWELPPGGIFLNIWTPPEEAYGGAVMIWRAKDGVIEGNDFQHQQNGVLLYECRRMKVTKNNTSFNSGWGISMYETTDSVIDGNVSDFCIRIHERGPRAYQAGADATGLLMVMNSSRNRITSNQFRGGGDGVFVGGFRVPNLKAPCNDNLFEGNDCSLSPNNAFESTFCEGNIFRDNKANNSNFGFWLGYSWKNVVENNDIRNNRIAGIAIEHGNNTRIEDNRITYNEHGVLLWSDGEEHFGTEWPQMKDSYDYVIKANSFDGNRYGIDCITGNGWWGQDAIPGVKANHGYAIAGNTFKNNRTGVRFVGVRDSKLIDNAFDDRHEKKVDLVDSAGIEQSGEKRVDAEAGK